MIYNKMIQGVAINDTNEPISLNGNILPFYDTWYNMLRRCYNPKSHIIHPTYTNCTVCDEWLLLSNFKRWYNENYIEGLHLDKDILVQGNKIYSPDTCCFVPRYINNLLTNTSRYKSALPLGVCALKPNKSKRKLNTTYQASCNDGYNKLLTKTFKTVEEAQAWYIETKKKVIKEQAQRAFLDNLINTDVYLALVRRKIN